MFYSQFILAKKGPLGTIWIAAHLERKLRKNQVADTDIGVSVDSILFPDVPIALRLSSHLLLGVVRIYNRKVNYLFDDCSEALLKIKQAFRSTAVDLPPEESKAPYHSITLPETFDLDDFELPDNDIFQGNYVDHHISSREQITLQDSMEGVSYSTSKFGLDERFGDGDASGLDLDEELFLDKIDTAGHADESAEPQASLGKDGHHEDRTLNLENMVDGVDAYTDLMDFAHAPCTPGLVEEPNFSNVQEVSTCDDPLESEYHLTESITKENSKNITNEDKQEVDWCFHEGANSDAMPHVKPKEYGYQSRRLEIKESKLQEESHYVEANVEHASLNEASSEVADKITKPSDVHRMEDIQNGMVNKDMPYSLSVDEPCDDHQDPLKNGSERSVSEISVLTSSCQQVSEGVPVKDQSPLGIEVPGSVRIASDHEKSYLDASEFALENKDGSFSKNPETPAYQEPADVIALKLDGHEKVASSETPFLRPCNSNLEQPDITNSGRSADIHTDITDLATSERDTATIACCITGNSEQVLKEIHVTEASCKDFHAASSEHDGQVHNANSQERLVENLNKSERSELPAPEKLLAVPDGHADLHRDMLEEVNPTDFQGLDEGDAGSKVVTGKKRSFTESTLTEQSLNSVESLRLVRIKRTAESIPDDDDLLSSILVGRRSSVLKVKPTPPFSEVTSMKRTRAASRSGPPKRKVLMDDTMVLHGDTIRQQLTSTEDIRRVRKKAPCTRPEISMIQNQCLEDEIFLEAILTGMSIELASLQYKMGDLSRIRVHQNDPNEASLKNVAEAMLPSQNNENGVSLENVAEPKLGSNNDRCDVSLETAVEPHLTSQNAENGMTLDIENDKWFSGPNVAEQSGMAVNCEYSTVRDNKIAVLGENSMLSDNKLEEVYSKSVDVNISQEQIDVGTDVFHQEFLLGVAELETHEKNADAGNPAVITEPESVSSIEHNDRNDASAGTFQTSLNKTCEKNSPVDVNTSNLLPDQMTDAPAPFVELDSAIMNLDNGQAIGRGEIKEENGTVDARDDVVSNVPQDGVAVELLPNAKHGELECYNQSEICSVTSGKQQALDSSFPAQVCVQKDGSMNSGENPAQPESYQYSMMNGEYSSFDLHGQNELNYLPPGNDTEFLNVDDDELTEIADDYMPEAEETPLTENSGWSSRTRAVSKYLQTIFVNEAECGRKSLYMDELLSGKSRKEASRMFFEALVLKTRDYIHVEQQNPFDSITIKPRARLMKSDF